MGRLRWPVVLDRYKVVSLTLTSTREVQEPGEAPNWLLIPPDWVRVSIAPDWVRVSIPPD